MVMIGKIFWIFCFTFQLILSKCDLQVKILDYNGQAISQVEAGVPFQIHVIANGECDVSNVEFADNFAICKLKPLGTIKSVTNINRVINHAINHRYLARIDQIGNYHLGPISLRHGIDLVGTLEVDLTVIDQNSGSKKQGNNIFVELKASKNQVYKGEQFLLKVRLYFNETQISGANLNLPTDLIDAFDYQVSQNVLQGIDGSKKQKYLEWSVRLTAKKIGELMLPAVGVVCEKINKNSSFFIFNSGDRKEFFSNSIKINVSDLPLLQDDIKHFELQGIGVFKDFILTASQQQIKAGEAVELSLKLVGEGNWDKITPPKLVVPQGLSIYSGSVRMAEDAKIFEYAIQALSPGEYKIESQPFLYFDTKTGAYKLIYSNSLDINVLEAAQNQLIKIHDIKKNNNKILNSSIRPIHNYDNFNSNTFYLPWPIFLGLVLLPTILIILFLIIRYFYFRQNSSFELLKKRLKKIERNGQDYKLYSFFTDVLVQKFNLSPANLDQDSLHNFLMLNFSMPDQIDEFCKFYNDLMAIAFAGNYRHDLNSNLFEKSMKWLIFLENLPC